jgi:hypothetical protein
MTHIATNSAIADAEIAITPEIIEAGADVIWTFFYDVLPLGSETGREAAIAVYRAMHTREK